MDPRPQPFTQLVKTASVRDLLMLVSHGKTPYVTRTARRELEARRLCGNCGSSAHTHCNA